MLQAKEGRGETSCAEVYGFSLSFRQRFYSGRGSAPPLRAQFGPFVVGRGSALPDGGFPLVKRSFF